MTFRIVHQTRYLYREPVSLCYNVARLRPRPLPYQSVEESTLAVEPAAVDTAQRVDYFGNPVDFFSIYHPHEILTVTAASRVRLVAENRCGEQSADMPWLQAVERLHRDTDEPTVDARQYVQDSPLVTVVPGLFDYAQASFTGDVGLLAAVFDLVHRIHRDFEYVPGYTSITTPMADLLQHRRGVCQDFAHFAIGCLRAVGVAARYVSGYIETLPPEGRAHLQGADASHAWFSVYLPGVGWVDFDPTNDQMPRDQHITVAWGRDYADVPPLKGIIFSSGSHKLSVAVEVQRIAD
jgi:transglutaminase-like putative cysteine protease